LRNKVSDNLTSIEEDGMNKFHTIIDKFIKEREIKPIFEKKRYVRSIFYYLLNLILQILYSDMLFKKILDATLIIVLIYVSVYYPYKISFLYNLKFKFGFFIIMDAIVDLFFLVDLISTFFTAVISKGVLIDDHYKIAENYLTGWFIIDLISIIPFYIVDIYYDQYFSNILDPAIISRQRTKSILGVLKVLRILKVSKIFKGNPFFDRLLYYLKMKSNVKKILLNFCFLLFTLHLVACFFYYTVSINKRFI
jgi:hypothetical protein